MAELILAGIVAYLGWKGARRVHSAYRGAKQEMYAERGLIGNYGDPYSYYPQPNEYYEDPYSQYASPSAPYSGHHHSSRHHRGSSYRGGSAHYGRY